MHGNCWTGPPCTDRHLLQSRDDVDRGELGGGSPIALSPRVAHESQSLDGVDLGRNVLDAVGRVVPLERLEYKLTSQPEGPNPSDCNVLFNRQQTQNMFDNI